MITSDDDDDDVDNSNKLSIVPRKHEVQELQNPAIFGTAHVLRKVLM